MPLGSSGYYIPAEWLVLAEFFCLALLCLLLLTLIRWEQTVANNRDAWLRQLRLQAGQLRNLRLQAQKMGSSSFALPVSPSVRRKWGMFRWLGKMLFSARAARP